jgi:ribonuclease R
MKNEMKEKDVKTLILQMFKDSKEKKYSFKQIRKKLRDTFSNDVIYEAIQELVHDDILVPKGTAYTTSKKKEVNKHVSLTGTIQITQSGLGFVTLENYDEDLKVNQRNTLNALNGDTVKIALLQAKSRGRLEAKVVEIVKRNEAPIIGDIDSNGKTFFLVPDAKKSTTDFFIPASKLNGAKAGDKVVGKFVEWQKDEKNPIAEVIQILGKAGDNNTEMHSILIDNGFKLEFPPEVIEECDKMQLNNSADEIAKRRDFRNITTFTIDPYDAKDFDDALSFQELENGIYEIGIHIADVSHYVQPGTATDIEAATRATSVYLVDRVIPMLPEKISNELCSIRPNEDKLTFSCVVKMNDKAEVLDQWIGKTIIHSDKRFTYEGAQEVLEGAESEYKKELLKLNELAILLKEKRFKNGAINFETVEVKFKLDEKGVPLGVYVKERKDANMLIEDFMLLANRLVSEFMSKKKYKGENYPFVYRVHDTPDMTKLEDLRDMARLFGYKLNLDTPNNISKTFNKMVEDVKGKPEQNMLESLAIRTMAKAIYTTQNIGHYGLAFKDYTHFTSPIRRYPDVLVHRILNTVLYGDEKNIIKDLENLCTHSSEMEKSAADAERMSIKYKQVEFMSTKVGSVFEGIISGATEWGIFVEIIENKCEGLIRLQNIEEDFYEYDEKNHLIKGRKYGKRFRLGDKIKVRVKKADLEKRQLDFEMVDD